VHMLNGTSRKTGVAMHGVFAFGLYSTSRDAIQALRLSHMRWNIGHRDGFLAPGHGREQGLHVARIGI
jgi:hypothetical protein